MHSDWSESLTEVVSQQYLFCRVFCVCTCASQDQETEQSRMLIGTLESIGTKIVMRRPIYELRMRRETEEQRNKTQTNS